MKILRTRAFLWRMRYFIIATTFLASLGVVIASIKELKPESVQLVVASEDLIPGTVLTSVHLHTSFIPVELAPESIIKNPEILLGRTLTSSVPKGFPLSEKSLLNEEFLRSAPGGTSILSISVIAQGFDDLLVPGRSVSLYAPPDEYSKESRAHLVVPRATIMGKAKKQKNNLTFSSDSYNKEDIYLAVPDESVSLVLGYGSMTPMSAVLIP